MDREKFLTKFLPLVGGKENTSLCEFQDETLYVTLKDASLVELDAVRKLPEVTSAKLGRSRLTVCFGASDKKEEKFIMANNQQIASDVLRAVGGKENVKAVTHCMTRLRFNLKDDKIPNQEEIKKLPGVLGVAISGGQFQIIVGQNVPKVYDEVCKLGGFAAQVAVDENLDGPKEPLNLKKIGSNIMSYLSGCMTPLLPILLAAGLVKALLAVLGPTLLGVISETDGLYILLDFIYDAGFYFIPILVGFNAAKKLNIPAHMGAYMGAVLLAPDFLQMATDGTPLTLFGLNIPTADYSQTVVPIMLSAAFLGLVYRVFAKIMPDTLSTIFTPFLSILVASPVALLWLAPLGTNLSKLISGGLLAFTNATGFFGYAFIGAVWEFLVLTGMHLVIAMPFTMDFFEKGYLAGAIQGATCATWACFGVALGAFLRLKNKDAKSMSLGFFVSGILGGVTEPALYGLCFKYRRCFISLAIGGAIGGAYAGITNVVGYLMSSTNFLAVLGYLGGSTSNFINGIIMCVLSLVAAAVATYFIGFTKEELEA